MKNDNIFNKMNKRLYKYIFGYLILLIAFLLTFLNFSIQYEVNDDSAIQELISGYKTGKPSVLPVYMTFLFSYIIKLLYFIKSDIPWYPMILISVNLYSIFIIYRIFLKKIPSTFFSITIFVCLYVGLFLYNLINVTYTTVAGFSLAALCVFLFELLFVDVSNKKEKVICYTRLFFLYFFSSNIRQDCAGLALVLSFYLITFVGVFYRKKIKKSILILGICIITILGTRFINEIYIIVTGWSDFKNLQVARSEYKDYDHLSYEGNEEKYVAIGWTREIYDLVDKWCFMDEKINEESYDYLNYIYKQEKETHYNIDVNNIVNKILSNDVARISILSWLALQSMIAVLLFIIRKKVSTNYSFLFVCSSGLFLIYCMFLIYLSLIGRMPLRTINVCFLGTFTPSILMDYIVMRKCANSKIVEIIGGCFIVLFMFPICHMGMTVCNNRAINQYDAYDVMCEIACDNKQNIYVYDKSLAKPNYPFITYDNFDGPYNIFFWGGWLDGSPLIKSQMERNGIEKITFESMLNDNYYFVGNQECMKLVMNYYEKEEIDVDIKIERFINGEDYFIYSVRRR